MTKSPGRPVSDRAKYAATVTPSGVKHQKPDMYNHVPVRAVSIEEAKSHGWAHFYDGEATKPCSRGHKAAHYVSNPPMCVDCNREDNGKPAIYPNEGGDLTSPAPSTYVEPIADRNFDWTEAKKDQFFEAWVNSLSIGEALRVIGAQNTHLIRKLDEDAAFREKFERTETVDLVRAKKWRANDSVLTNDRMQQLQAQRMFPDSFGSGASAGLGRTKIGSPEQIDAEFAQLIRGISRTSGTEVPTGSPPNSRDDSKPEPGLVAVGEGSNPNTLTSGGVPEEVHADCDLVS